MSYAMRNNLTIAGILLLLSLIGFFWYRAEAEELTRVQKEQKEVSMRLSDDLEVTTTLDNFVMAKDSLERKLRYAPKKLISAREPTFSLSYINWLIRNYGLELDFDFFLNNSKAGKKYTTFTYTLTGEGDYENFCALIYYLTNNPILYKINDVSLSRSTKRAGLLNFSMSLQGFSLNEATDEAQDLQMIPSRVNWLSEFRHDAFSGGYRPVVETVSRPASQPAPSEARRVPQVTHDPNLVDVENASLVVIANNTIYLRPKNGGSAVSLKVGDRVRGGKLVRIDQTQNTAMFELDTGNGGFRLFRLELEYN